MDVTQYVRANNGVARRARLQAAGATNRQIATAVATGGVRAVGAAWLATDSCPPPVIAALTVGGRLTCISAAHALGLWAIDDGMVHVAVRSNHPRPLSGGSVRSHWGFGPTIVPIGSPFLPLPDVLYHVARCQPFENAVAVFDSALNKGLVAPRELAVLSGVIGGAFSRIVEASDQRADSGIESLTRVRLREIGIIMRLQARIDGHRVDGLIGDHLVIQTDGFGPHSERSQRNRDLAQDARLARQGYVVLRFSYDQVVHDWPFVESTILAAMAMAMAKGDDVRHGRAHTRRERSVTRS